MAWQRRSATTQTSPTAVAICCWDRLMQTACSDCVGKDTTNGLVINALQVITVTFVHFEWSLQFACFCVLCSYKYHQYVFSTVQDITERKLEAIQRWSAMSRVTLNFDLSKFLLCISSHRQDLYSHQKLNMYIYCFSSESGYRRRRRRRRADNAGRHSTTTRATFRQLCLSVRLYVCLRAHFRKCTSKLQIFGTRYIWLWLGPLLATFGYVVYFRFCGWHTGSMAACHFPHAAWY